jgi:hypothetical protein
LKFKIEFELSVAGIPRTGVPAETCPVYMPLDSPGCVLALPPSPINAFVSVKLVKNAEA